jgi:hypothetical protein
VTLYFAQERASLERAGVLDWLEKISLGHLKETGKDAVLPSDLLVLISPEASPDLARWAPAGGLGGCASWRVGVRRARGWQRPGWMGRRRAPVPQARARCRDAPVAAPYPTPRPASASQPTSQTACLGAAPAALPLTP